MFKRKISFTAVAGVAAAAALALSPSAASADETHFRTPDPGQYCAENPPYQLQVSQADWSVYSGGRYRGNSVENNAQCEYDVSASVPTGAYDYALPPVRTYTKVDWRTACAQQFPGSRLSYTPGPINPGWHCLIKY